MFDAKTESRTPPSTTTVRRPPRDPRDSDESSLLLLLDVVWRRGPLLVAISALVMTVIMLESYSKTPMFRAQARLMIQDERSTAVAGMNSSDPAYAYWRDPEQYSQTQFRVLQGRALITRTLERPDIDLSAVPEFNGELVERVGPVDAIQAGVSYGLAPMRSVAGRVAAVFRNEFPATRDAGDDQPSAESETDRQVNAFASRIAVQPVLNTRLVDVSFSGADPAFVATAVNALAEQYVEDNLALRLEDTNGRLQWVRIELAKVREQLADSERAMADYRISHDALSLEERQDVVVATLQQLNNAVNAARTRRIQKEAVYLAIDSLQEDPEAIEAFLEVTGGPYPQELQTRLTRQREEQLALRARYGERHPQLIAINVAIDRTSAALRRELITSVSQIGTEYQVALAEEAELTREFERQKGVAMTLDLDSVNYHVLEREAQTARNLYESLLKQEKELAVIGTSRTNNVRVLERAMVPQVPYSPDHAMDRFTALLVGLPLSLGFVLLLDRFNSRIRTPEDLKRSLGVPVVGFVPAVSKKSTAVLNDDSPHEVVEALRSIRTNLLLTTEAAPNRARIIAVTSSHPLEGKTTTACGLALTLAKGGAQVLLIDADLRRPSVHTTLALDNSVGFTQILTGAATPRAGIRRTGEANLHVIPAGETPTNPPELLSSERMRRTIEQIATGPFDWVIIDTPPVLAVTDALLITPFVTAVIFVVHAGLTPTTQARHALTLMRETNPTTCVTALLNGMETQKTGYAYRRYHGRRYYSYYAARTTA